MFQHYECFIEETLKNFLDKICVDLSEGVYRIEKNYYGEIKVIKEEFPENLNCIGVSFYFCETTVNSDITSTSLDYKIALYNNMKKIEEEIVKYHEKNYTEGKPHGKD